MKLKFYLLTVLGILLSACGGTLEISIERTPEVAATQVVLTQIAGTATPPPSTPTLVPFTIEPPTVVPAFTITVSESAATATTAPLMHIVQSGETLFRIALKYGVTVDALRAANSISGDTIYVGQSLIIPNTIAIENAPTAVPPDPTAASATGQPSATASLSSLLLKVILEIPNVDGLTNAVWSPDGKWLAVSTSSGVDLYDTQTLKLARSLANPIAPTERRLIAFSLDGRWLAMTGNEPTIQIWDVSSGQLSQTLTGHTAKITSLFFSADSAILASTGFVELTSSGPGHPVEIRLWEASTGKPLAARNLGSASAVGVHAFNADQTLLIHYSFGDSCSRGFTGSVELWSLDAMLSGQTDAVPIWRKDNRTGPLGVSVRHKGRIAAFLASSSCIGGGTVAVWDSAGTEISRFSVDWNSGLAFSPSLPLLAVAGNNQPGEGVIQLRNAEDGQLVRALIGHTILASWLYFSQDGQWLASTAPDQTVRLWNVNTGQLLYTFDQEDGTAIVFDNTLFSPDSRLLMTRANGSLRLRLLK